MGSVFRKSFTKALPNGAEVFTKAGKRFARWKDAKGKTRTARLTRGKDGSDRIIEDAKTFTAKYRDGNGIVRELATGCRDETAARSVLADLERRAELVKAGVISSVENSVAQHQSVLIATHFAAYRDYQVAKGLSSTRIKNTTSRLNRLALECDFATLSDLDCSRLERWLASHAEAGMSAGNRNAYRQEVVGFANWCIRTRRLVANPFSGVPQADARADCRRKRRALTETELAALLDAAQRRPLLEALTVRRGKRRGEAVGKVRPEIRLNLERLGLERALIYKTLVLTGLRKGELASITIGQLHLDAPTPHLELAAADEKNGKGSSIPLRSDLVEDLRAWLQVKAETLNSKATALPSNKKSTTEPRLSQDQPLFDVPAGLLRILDRDLVLAGIAREVVIDGKVIVDKTDERGRTVDLHALRHTYGTMLSRAGVAPRTAQAAMRHSTIDLTMNVYTDPKLLDVAGAIESLPFLPIKQDVDELRNGRAPIASESESSTLAPTLALTGDHSWPLGGSQVTSTTASTLQRLIALSSECAADGNKKRSLTQIVNERFQVERKGVEPSTSALRTQRSPN